MAQISKNLPELVMLVGLPACGKSYFSEQHPDYKWHSSDELRKRILHSEDDQSNIRMIFDRLHEELKADLLAGYSCIYDATNVSAHLRMNTLHYLDGIPCKKVCQMIIVPLPVLIARNAARKRTVPIETYDKFLSRWNTPMRYEGWDEIRIFRNSTESEAPIGSAYFDMPLNDAEHAVSLKEHMKAAERYARSQGWDECLCKACGFMDTGRAWAKEFRGKNDLEGKGQPDYKDESYGAYRFLVYAKDHPDIPVEDALRISWLIEKHSQPYTWDASPEAEKKDHELWGDALFTDILRIHEADQAAR